MDPVIHDAYRTDLPRTMAAVHQARQFLRRVAEEDGLAETVDVRLAELLTTELVSNAIEHAEERGPADAVSLAVAVLPGGGVLVEVRDRGGELVEGLLSDAPVEEVLALSVAAEVEWLPEEGRGLLLVRRLSDACGSWATPHGKAAWFLLRGTRVTKRTALRGWWRRHGGQPRGHRGHRGDGSGDGASAEGGAEPS